VYSINWANWSGDVLDELDSCPDVYADTITLDGLDDCFGIVTSAGWAAQGETMFNIIVAESESFYFVGRQNSTTGSAHFISEAYPDTTFFQRIDVSTDFWVDLTHCGIVPY